MSLVLPIKNKNKHKQSEPGRGAGSNGAGLNNGDYLSAAAVSRSIGRLEEEREFVACRPRSTFSGEGRFTKVELL